MTTKTCTKCNNEKPTACFCKNKNTKDGLNCHCKECAKIAKKDWDAKNKDRTLNYAKQYRAREDYKPSKPTVAQLKKYCDKQKMRHKENMKDIEYRTKRIADATFRKHAKKQRTPPWLTREQKKEMQFMYLFAQSIKGLHGLSYHVDHIHPLQGENFSGLHVPWNLQILSASENCSKRNSLTLPNSIEIII
jgi:hypothetical protein